MGRRKKGSYLPEDVNYVPSSEEIGRRARDKWIARGCIDGYSQQDWLEAEAELKDEHRPSLVEFIVCEARNNKEVKKQEPPVQS